MRKKAYLRFGIDCWYVYSTWVYIWSVGVLPPRNGSGRANESECRKFTFTLCAGMTSNFLSFGILFVWWDLLFCVLAAASMGHVIGLGYYLWKLHEETKMSLPVERTDGRCADSHITLFICLVVNTGEVQRLGQRNTMNRTGWCQPIWCWFWLLLRLSLLL